MLETVNNNEAIPIAREHPQSVLNKFYCGFAAGILQAGIFNPWDRALYLSVKNHCPFLLKENFLSPFSGLVQTLFHRSISSSLYFPLEDIILTYLNENFGAKSGHEMWMAFVTGTLAGAANGLILNPLSAVKYHTWGLKTIPDSAFKTVKYIYSEGGIRPFFVGTTSTVARDMLFGGVFTFLRYELRLINKNRGSTSHHHLMIDMFAGFWATILSSPLNYVRTIQYSTPPSVTHKKMYVVFREIIHEIRSLKNHSTSDKFHYVQDKLKIGWGTARVCCGVAFGGYVYSFLSESSID